MEDTNNIKSKLRDILQEWHDFPIPGLIPRDADTAPFHSSRIVSIIGPRRAGKTWFCFQVMKELLEKGTPRDHIIYVNFEDERLTPLTGAELTHLLEAQWEVRGIQKPEIAWCFLDEIQNVPNWSKWVRRASDQNAGLRIILTGSSSKLLSSEIATELRGRTWTVRLQPYGLAEFMDAHGADRSPAKVADLHGSRRREARRNYLHFAERGGFPGLPEVGFREVLQENYRAMFNRDILERFTVKNKRLLEDYLKIQLSRFASLSSISNLEGELKSLGHRFTKNTLNAFLGYAKDVFLLYETPIYSPKAKNQLLYPRKVYGIDQGLLRAIRFSASEDRGRYLENMVFLELNRRGLDLYYAAGKGECDFVVMSGHKPSHAIQACFEMGNPKTRQREIDGLIEAMDQFGLKKGLIITDDEDGIVEIAKKKIRIKPFWYFALQSGESALN